MNFHERFGIRSCPLDGRGRLSPDAPGFWSYLGLDPPPSPVHLAEIFHELVGREGEIGAVVGKGAEGIRIPSVFRNDLYFDLHVLPDEGNGALVALQDATRSLRAQQELLQQRNEIDLLKRDLELQNADLSTANRRLDILGRSLAERNEELASLMATIREQNHDLESKVRLRTRDLRDSRLSLIAKLARVAEFRDRDTGGHIYRIGRSCVLVGKRLGLAEEEREDLFHASLLHDVGKIGIPDSILLKPGPLALAEREIMKSHALIGEEILAGDDFALFRKAREVARHHHERWDGSGYPDALRGEGIPLMARICAIADVFDALMSKRPYKKAWSLELARAEIEKGAGSAFDPAVAGAFFSALDDIVRLRQDAALGEDGLETLPELD